ncbi:hypothetical protein EGW08_007301 [Elysia chlorotica]|uniref:Potassium channel tetramerisation-type BTB domain-containing protein n=1 Tax=Elysia chlorotica TaxID=188477 RepID=A0A3S0ZSR8_ELYCH|nr:hypothetical protein EGW08_007301 [Elysia chlorotica]
MPEPLPMAQEYNILSVDKGSSKPEVYHGHGQFSHLHRSLVSHRHHHPSTSHHEKNTIPKPHETGHRTTETDTQTVYPFSQDNTVGGYPPFEPNILQEHPPQQLQQQHLQQQTHPFFKQYHQQSLIHFPFPPACQADIYVDRNPTLLPFILDAYRIGQLHLPSNVCSLNIRAELDFWKLPEDLICECCWMSYHQGLKTMGVVNTICRAF